MSKKKYTELILREAVTKSFSWAGVCRVVGVKPFTGAQSHLKKISIQFGIDFSHFTGKGHMKGKTGKRKNINDLLVVVDKNYSSDGLKKRLFREGLFAQVCDVCHRSEWMGHQIKLELHHRNSNHFDNRIENLQILCPTCHAMIDLLG